MIHNCDETYIARMFCDFDAFRDIVTNADHFTIQEVSVRPFVSLLYPNYLTDFSECLKKIMDRGLDINKSKFFLDWRIRKFIISLRV